MDFFNLEQFSLLVWPELSFDNIEDLPKYLSQTLHHLAFLNTNNEILWEKVRIRFEEILQNAIERNIIASGYVTCNEINNEVGSEILNAYVTFKQYDYSDTGLFGTWEFWVGNKE